MACPVPTMVQRRTKKPCWLRCSHLKLPRLLFDRSLQKGIKNQHASKNEESAASAQSISKFDSGPGSIPLPLPIREPFVGVAPCALVADSKPFLENNGRNEHLSIAPPLPHSNLATKVDSRRRRSTRLVGHQGQRTTTVTTGRSVVA
jgi:hypothetical protein